MWLSPFLLLSIPLLLSISAWCLTRGPRINNGRAFWVLSIICIGLYTSALLLKLFLPAYAQNVDFISTSALSYLMLGLILFMASILVKFSYRYMDGEARVAVYWRWLLNTLAAVSLVVIANHLVVFWLAWVTISLSLHQLLSFYPERPRAILAAHKKFILARCAELCLLLAFIFLYLQHQSLNISEIAAYYQLLLSSPNASLSNLDHAAATLIALAALIKCAQLPMHGWLIQVVEAPTPVSALLHAGVINLGGFLLILFAPLFIQSAMAVALILIVAGLSTVICALIMTTRVSIKVRLAWSTSAQMGLMLVECALGLFELALLHLIAHSAYKAFSFLNSGSAVLTDVQYRMNQQHTPSFWQWSFALLMSGALVLCAVWWMEYQGVLSIWLLLALALSILLAHQGRQFSVLNLALFVILGSILVASYSLSKIAFAYVIDDASAYHQVAWSLADIWVMLLFIALFVLSVMLRYFAHKPAMQFLSIQLFAGLYLDEWLTRLTIKIWPIYLPKRVKAKTLASAKPKRVEEY